MLQENKKSEKVFLNIFFFLYFFCCIAYGDECKNDAQLENACSKSKTLE